MTTGSNHGEGGHLRIMQAGFDPAENLLSSIYIIKVASLLITSLWMMFIESTTGGNGEPSYNNNNFKKPFVLSPQL